MRWCFKQFFLIITRCWWMPFPLSMIWYIFKLNTWMNSDKRLRSTPTPFSGKPQGSCFAETHLMVYIGRWDSACIHLVTRPPLFNFFFLLKVIFWRVGLYLGVHWPEVCCSTPQMNIWGWEGSIGWGSHLWQCIYFCPTTWVTMRHLQRIFLHSWRVDAVTQTAFSWLKIVPI